MEANKILTAHLLDIIFEGKNKAYGAYELRKFYNKRILLSLIITISIIVMLFLGSAITGHFSKDLIPAEVPDMVLKQVQPLEPPSPPPPILPVSPLPPARIAFQPPLIVKDNLVVKPPPEIQQLLVATIDVKTIDGSKDVTIIDPPLDLRGSQVVPMPLPQGNKDSVFIKVEIDASFPGGANSWSKYVGKTVTANADEFTEPYFGTCIVKFIVDKTGKVSQVEAITMKNTKLAEIAANAIKKGPNWIPAQQNGSYVNAYRFQPVTLNNPGQ